MRGVRHRGGLLQRPQRRLHRARHGVCAATVHGAVLRGGPRLCGVPGGPVRVSLLLLLLLLLLLVVVVVLVVLAVVLSSSSSSSLLLLFLFVVVLLLLLLLSLS